MSIFQDIRYALRLLVKSRVSTIVAVLSLALGIGATTAIFSVVYAVLVDPYPYVGAERIGGAHVLNVKGDHYIGYTMAEYLEMQTRAQSVESMILNNRRSVVMTEAGLPEAVIQEDFSPNAFEFFGVPPLFGRTFSPRDTGNESKAEPVAVLSYLFWQRHFAGRREVLGLQIRLNDKFFTIIGVLPVRFTWNDADIYVPMELHPDIQERFGGGPQGQARHPQGTGQRRISEFSRKIRESSTYLCLSRSSFPHGVHVCERRDPRQVRQHTVGAAGRGGIPAVDRVRQRGESPAGAGQRAAGRNRGARRHGCRPQARGPATLDRKRDSVRDGRGAGRSPCVWRSKGGGRADAGIFRAARSCNRHQCAGVVFRGGGFGADRNFCLASRPPCSFPVRIRLRFSKPLGGIPAQVRRGRRLRNVLIVSEVTLSLVLLTGAALAAAGMLELTRQKLGYQPQGVLTLYVFTPAAHYPQWSQRQAHFTNIIERLRKLPGAESVAATLTGVPPYSGAPSKFDIDGLPSAGTKIRVNLVSEAYFNTMGIPLLKGRYFDAADVTRVNPVAVVTEDLVKKYFPSGQDPMGRLISLDLFTGAQPPNFVKSPQDPHAFQIVGICGTARNSGLRDAPEPAVYLPFSTIFPPGMLFAIRTTKSDPLALSNGARQAVSSVDPSQPIAFVRTLDEFVKNELAYPRFATFLFGIFGAIGLTLACTGIFSVVSYAVSRRTREFGIRMALGATPGNVLRLIVASTGHVLVVGFVLGAILSVVLDRALAGKLEGIGVASPTLLVAITSVLAVAALLACAVPARSATKVQPVDALRHE